MGKVSVAVASVIACGVSATVAQADVEVRISKSRQMMYVYVDGEHYYSWPVSTARGGYNTPNGVYRPQRLALFHRSSKYNNSPMPYSIFFHGGYAIHGSYDIGNLGRPASHGCIRLHPSDARELYGLVSDSDYTRIVVTY